MISEGADITLVSPDVEPEIKQMAEERRIKWEKRTIEKEDYLNAFFIIAATDNAAVNKEIAQSASPFQLVNCVSDAELGNVYMPKIVKEGMSLCLFLQAEPVQSTRKSLLKTWIS